MNTALPSNLSGRNAHLSGPGIRRLLARARQPARYGTGDAPAASEVIKRP